jgi:hypothetical protein
MLNERHQTKHFEERTKDMCNYCHRTPAVWHQVGSEKICAHCGTRVFNSAVANAENVLLKSSNR